MPQTIATALEASGAVKFDGEYAAIPAHMQDAIRRYVLHGKKPGDFLTAVICNDLRNAVLRADETNYVLLRTYILWFYNVPPGSCQGSRANMEEWMYARSMDDFQAAGLPETVVE